MFLVLTEPKFNIKSMFTKFFYSTKELALWRHRIFKYLAPNKHNTLQLRSKCRLFRDSLDPLELYTIFPHPKYSSLNMLFSRLKMLSGSLPIVLIKNGIHINNYNIIDVSMSIIGESQDGCKIGGLNIKGKKKDDVYVQNLTICESTFNGVYAKGGASIHLDNVSVKKSGKYGVYVAGTKRNTMTNCNIHNSKESGLWVYNGLMTIDGSATTLHHNCTNFLGTDYGMYGSIHLVSPLTKETVSTNNGGDGNYPTNGSEALDSAADEAWGSVTEMGILTIPVEPVEVETYTISELQGKVNLISSEGETIKVEARTAAMSELVNSILIDDDSDVIEQEIPLPNVKTTVLTKVVEFCNYHVANGPMKNIEIPIKSANMKKIVGEWDANFIDSVYEGVGGCTYDELMEAAHYMDIGMLEDLVGVKIASMLYSQTPDEMCQTLNIVNDMTPEEKEKVEAESKWLDL